MDECNYYVYLKCTSKINLKINSIKTDIFGNIDTTVDSSSLFFV